MLVEATVHELCSCDAAFVDLRTEGFGTTTVAALEAFWKREDHAATMVELGPPPADFATFMATMQRLVEGKPAVGSPGGWASVALATAEVTGDDPVATSMIALLAMAAWQGGTGAAIYDLPMGALPDRGWTVFPLAVARAFLAADAVWAGVALTRETIDHLGAAYAAPYDQRIVDLIDEYAALEAAFTRRIDTLSHELAYALRGACAPEEPSFRPEIAALLWTMGDAPHAHALAAGTTLPTLTQMRLLVAESMRRIPEDPLVQYVWLELKDRAPVDLRAHAALFSRINAMYRGTPMHAFDSQQPGVVGSPAQAFARLAVAHFRSAVTPELLEHGQLGAMLASELAPVPSYAGRMATLVALVSGDRSAAPWRALVDGATLITAEQRAMARTTSFDTSLDLPFTYLPGAVADRIDLLERYRAANLWYWFAAAPPRSGRPTDDLTRREDTLLGRLRALLLVRLLPDLPRHYSRVSVAFGPKGAPDTADLLDPDRADERLRVVLAELDALDAELAARSPDYAARRSNPAVTLEQFASILQA
jgi:hypothetical protein